MICEIGFQCLELLSSLSSSPSSSSSRSSLRYRRHHRHRRPPYRRHGYCVVVVVIGVVGAAVVRRRIMVALIIHPQVSKLGTYRFTSVQVGHNCRFMSLNLIQRERERKREIFIYGNVPRRSSTKSHVTLVAVGKKRNVILFKRRTSSCEVRRPRDNDFFI